MAARLLPVPAAFARYGLRPDHSRGTGGRSTSDAAKHAPPTRWRPRIRDDRRGAHAGGSSAALVAAATLLAAGCARHVRVARGGRVATPTAPATSTAPLSSGDPDQQRTGQRDPDRQRTGQLGEHPHRAVDQLRTGPDLGRPADRRPDPDPRRPATAYSVAALDLTTGRTSCGRRPTAAWCWPALVKLDICETVLLPAPAAAASRSATATRTTLDRDDGRTATTPPATGSSARSATNPAPGRATRRCSGCTTPCSTRTGTGGCRPPRPPTSSLLVRALVSPGSPLNAASRKLRAGPAGRRGRPTSAGVLGAAADRGSTTAGQERLARHRRRRRTCGRSTAPGWSRISGHHGADGGAQPAPRRTSPPAVGPGPERAAKLLAAAL